MELQQNYNTLPFDKIFGVFVTIRRSQKLPDYPEDIHGCIGYWDNDYKAITKESLFQHMIDVGKSALYNDNRRTFFPPVETDLETIVEVDFMLLPTYSINSKTGIISKLEIPFNNTEFGLIVDSSSGPRATYLPHVFENKSWKWIKNSLIDKAKTINNNTVNRYLAYKIIQFKYKLFEMTPDNILYKILDKTIDKNKNKSGGFRKRSRTRTKKHKNKIKYKTSSRISSRYKNKL